MKVTIEKLDSGYLVVGDSRVISTRQTSYAVEELKAALARALYVLEGKSEHLGGEYYARLDISYDEP